MISVDKALKHVCREVQLLAAKTVALHAALGLQLAEPIISGIDSPPFDKSMLDGYAITATDAGQTLKVIEEVHAGGAPHHAVYPGATIRLMTGAPVPDGADAVVKHEDCQENNDKTEVTLPEEIKSGAGILPRASSFHKGQELLSPGRTLTPIDLALMAEVGKAEVTVIPRPKVAVLATGNELVEAGQPVGTAQICNSNGPMLLAVLQSQHIEAVDLGIGRDDPDELKRLFEQGLEADVLLVSGGVSAGVLDLVPGVLKDLGVEEVFHKVKMKPGKPLWFGVKDSGDKRKYVFGLPGNPVSSLVGYELFVRPALAMLGGAEFTEHQTFEGVLTGEASHRGGRPTYLPCRATYGKKTSVEPLPWRGSADLAALAQANALAVLPKGDYTLPVGEKVDLVRLSSNAIG